MFKNSKICIFMVLAAGLLLHFGAVGQPHQAAQNQPAPGAKQPKAFSFAVYGDSRTMMYLPYKEGHEDKIHKVLVDVFSLVLSEKVAEAVVKKHVKLTFDPITKELVHVQMPFMTASEVMFLTLDKGWITEAAVEDVKLLPGVRRTMYRLSGGDWVAREMVRDVQAGRARFLVSTGDIVWWGKQGITVHDSPFWKRVNEHVLSKLPAPDAEMRAAGLEGRFYPSVGNHEVWGDPKIEGVLNTLPYLKKLGVSSKWLIYTYDFNGVRFIYLWSGKYDYRSPSLWDSEEPVYAEQMKQMKKWLDEAKAKGIRKAFIVFHYPVFCRSGMGAIPEKANPHKEIAAYAKDLELVVFNGHVHTTELYDVDGVKYLVLGGGGAEQDPILPGRSHVRVPKDYPRDLYWKGEDRKEEYNYVLVDVDPNEKTRFTLNRYRPWAATPFESVELYKPSK
jgi:predicted phosphohydrolase